MAVVVVRVEPTPMEITVRQVVWEVTPAAAPAEGREQPALPHPVVAVLAEAVPLFMAVNATTPMEIMDQEAVGMTVLQPILPASMEERHPLLSLLVHTMYQADRGRKAGTEDREVEVVAEARVPVKAVVLYAGAIQIQETVVVAVGKVAVAGRVVLAVLAEAVPFPFIEQALPVLSVMFTSQKAAQELVEREVPGGLAEWVVLGVLLRVVAVVKELRAVMAGRAVMPLVVAAESPAHQVQAITWLLTGLLLIHPLQIRSFLLLP